MRIQLYNSDFYAEVDEDDYEELSKHSWCYNGGYAHRVEKGTKRSIMMHRQILGILDNPILFGDHINHDRLNNTKANLRACTRRENNLNRRLPARLPNTGIKKEHRTIRGPNGGVREVFIAGCKGKHLGTFSSLEKAQEAINDFLVKTDTSIWTSP